MVSSKKIQERNYETLFRWLTQSNKINFIGRVVLSVPPMWQVTATDLAGMAYSIGAHHINITGHARAVYRGETGPVCDSARSGFSIWPVQPRSSMLQHA